MPYSFFFSTEGAVGGAYECKNAVMDQEFMPQHPLYKFLGCRVEFCSDPFLPNLVWLLFWWALAYKQNHIASYVVRSTWLSKSRGGV